MTESQLKQKRFANAARILLNDILDTNGEIVRTTNQQNSKSSLAKKYLQASVELSEKIKKLPETSLNSTTIKCTDQFESIAKMLRQQAALIAKRENYPNTSLVATQRSNRDQNENFERMFLEIDSVLQTLKSI